LLNAELERKKCVENMLVLTKIRGKEGLLDRGVCLSVTLEFIQFQLVKLKKGSEGGKPRE
jgi:hypothetical protein